MITKRAWFGPKRGLGWGWTPVSWEGWLVVAICGAVIAAAFALFGQTPMTGYVVIGAVASLILVCVMTGTRPG